MEDCIFCKIVRGEIPSEKVYEDEETMVFADIHPKAPGHTLLVTKEHYQWFTDLPDELYIKLMTVAHDLAKKLKLEYQADYVRLSIVGRDVAHMHVHLIPQKIADTKALGV